MTASSSSAVGDKPKQPRTYTISQYTESEIVEISLRRSDGDPSRWPSIRQRTRVVDERGHVDYYDQPTEKESRLWRKKIGRFLARYPLRADGLYLDPSQCYLKDFPDGYILLTRLSGDKDVPRRDCYLYGGPRRFDSPAEYCLHTKWLVENCPVKIGPSRTKRQCECVICDGTVSQRVLTNKYNLNDLDDTDKPKRSRKGKRGEERVDRPIMAKDYTTLSQGVVQMYPLRGDIDADAET